MTAFSALLQSIEATGDGWSIAVGEDWRQGRTLYGGLSAALCLEAALRAAPDLPPLRSAQIAFVGPATEDLRLSARVLRQGKSATFINADVTSGGQTATHATFCFGAPRASAYARSAARAPVVPAPEACPDFFPPKRGPVFAQHYDAKLAAGAPPMSSASEADNLIWTRHRDPQAPANAVSLLALADVPPPAAFSLFAGPAPISTMTWMVDVLDERALTAPGWKLLRSTAVTVGDGYSAQTMAIWDDAGAPVAIGQQTVAVFA